MPLDTLTYAQAQGLLDGLGGKITYLARLQPVAWALIVNKEWKTSPPSPASALPPAPPAAWASSQGS